MELQLPLVERILAENPGVEYHVWNLARTADDGAFVRSLAGERITVINDMYGDSSWSRFDDVYRHYSTSKWSECLFVKLDDDVVFIETDRFPHFIDAVESHPGTVVSANVVNNGACTATIPGLWDRFCELGIPLLDVHRSSAYATACHEYFLGNWRSIVGRPVIALPTREWLSINMIGFDWAALGQIAAQVGTLTPPEIAGRHFGQTLLGDEGMVNLLPRVIVDGFTAAHLSFGPQRIDDAKLESWRRGYARIGLR